MPRWMTSLDPEHWLRKAAYGAVQEAASAVSHVRDVNGLVTKLTECEYIEAAQISHRTWLRAARV